MDLFRPQPTENLLPRDGVVHYHGPILTAQEERTYFETLRNDLPWAGDEVVVFGKRHLTARKVVWCGDEGLDYTYSGTTRRPFPWHPAVLTLKSLAEERAGVQFNSCLLNLYSSGAEGMGWHSDDEKALEPQFPIACLSLGAERKFQFRHKHLPLTAGLVLEGGSLLVMRGETQERWQHSVPKMLRVGEPRISLTFRRMIKL